MFKQAEESRAFYVQTKHIHSQMCSAHTQKHYTMRETAESVTKVSSRRKSTGSREEGRPKTEKKDENYHGDSHIELNKKVKSKGVARVGYI